MTPNKTKEIVEKANEYFDKEFISGNTTYELRAIRESIEEHTYCYSIGWCLKNEINTPPSKRTIFAGGGPLMISKISEDIQMAGSAPTVDWIKKFELKVRDLEGYWCLELKFNKSEISSLKSLLNLSTPELLKKVNNDSVIQLEGEEYELQNLKIDLKNAGIDSKIELKERRKSSNTRL